MRSFIVFLEVIIFCCSVVFAESNVNYTSYPLLPFVFTHGGKHVSSEIVRTFQSPQNTICRIYGDVVEIIFFTSKGIRQDFIVFGEDVLSCKGDVKFDLQVIDGFQILDIGEDEVKLKNANNKVITYAGLKVFDVVGNSLYSTFTWKNENTVSIVIKHSDVKYPIYIDPTYLDEDWESLSPNWTNGVINSVDFNRDNGEVYVGGAFTSINGVSANRVARYKNSQWQTMGQGFNNIVHSILTLSNGNVCAGGSFTFSGGNQRLRIALWNGSSWLGMSSGFDGTVYTLTESVDGKIFAGGSFTKSGDNTKNLNHIAFWNGSYWEEPSLGVGGQGDYVLALSVDNLGNVYVGGKFQYAGGTSASNIARWNVNASTWHSLGSGVNGVVNAIVVDSENRVYVGGEFTSAGGIPANRIAVWNGVSWSSLGAGVDGAVYTLKVSDEFSLFIGGGFNYTGNSVGPNHLGWWHRNQWTPITSGIQGSSFYVRSLALDSNFNLYVAGSFYGAGGVESYNIARLKKPPSFEVKYMSGSGGTILGQAVQWIMRGDNGTEVVAQPNSNFHFDKWSDGLLSPSRTETNVMSNLQFTAYFLPIGEEGIAEEGENEGVIEGNFEGIIEGILEGDGYTEGFNEGEIGNEGTEEGLNEGGLEGEGLSEGVEGENLEGVYEGYYEGSVEGNIEGIIEGSIEGTPIEGELEGYSEGEHSLTVWIDSPNFVDREIGESLSLLAKVSGGEGYLDFQWYHKDLNDITYRLEEQIQPLLYIEVLGIEDTGYYWCEVSDDFSVASSNKIYVRVSKGLIISSSFLLIVTLLLISFLLTLIGNSSTKKESDLR